MRNCFPYLFVLKHFTNYHFHILVYKKDYYQVKKFLFKNYDVIYFCTHTYDSIVFCCGTKNDGFFTKSKNNYYISDCLYRTRGQKTVYILCIFKKHLLKKTVLKIFSKESRDVSWLFIYNL